jgi:tetracycline resistance efflux pump
MPPYLMYLSPVLYFLLSVLVSFIIGSEWGTLSIMIPLLVCVKDYHNLLLILGAVISGVIAGAQLSPISNTATTVSAIFEVDLLKSYLYRIKYSLLMILFSTIVYFLLGYFL